MKKILIKHKCGNIELKDVIKLDRERNTGLRSFSFLRSYESIGKSSAVRKKRGEVESLGRFSGHR